MTDDKELAIMLLTNFGYVVEDETIQAEPSFDIAFDYCDYSILQDAVHLLGVKKCG